MNTRVPPAPGRSRPHTPADIAEANRWRESGWSYGDIQGFLADAGVRVHRRTIQLWTNPEAAATHRRNDLAVKRRARARALRGRLAGHRSPEFRATRVHSLRDTGMSCSAIAKAMTFDFPDHPLTEHQVRRMIEKAAA